MFSREDLENSIEEDEVSKKNKYEYSMSPFSRSEIEESIKRDEEREGYVNQYGLKEESIDPTEPIEFDDEPISLEHDSFSRSADVASNKLKESQSWVESMKGKSPNLYALGKMASDSGEYVGELAKGWSVSVNEAYHSIFDTMSNSVSRKQRKMKEAVSRIKDVGVDEYIREVRKKNKWPVDSYNAPISEYERKSIMQEVPTMFEDEIVEVGDFIDNVFKNMSSRTEMNEVVKQWKSDVESGQAERSGGSMNPLNPETSVGDAILNVGSNLTAMAPITAVTAMNPIAGTSMIYAMNNKSYRDLAKSVGLTDEETSIYESEASAISSAIGAADELLKVNKIPYVGKLMDKIGGTIAGKTLGLLGKATGMGALEWSEDEAVPKYFIGKSLRDKGLTEDEIKKLVQRTPMLESPNFWLGAGVGAGMDLATRAIGAPLSDQVNPIEPTRAEQLMLEASQEEAGLAVYDKPVYSKIDRNQLEAGQEGIPAPADMSVYDKPAYGQIPRAKLEGAQPAIEGQQSIGEAGQFDSINNALMEGHKMFIDDINSGVKMLPEADRNAIALADPSIDVTTLQNQNGNYPSEVIKAIENVTARNKKIAENEVAVAHIDGQLKNIEEQIARKLESGDTVASVDLVMEKNRLESDKNTIIESQKTEGQKATEKVPAQKANEPSIPSEQAPIDKSVAGEMRSEESVYDNEVDTEQESKSAEKSSEAFESYGELPTEKAVDALETIAEVEAEIEKLQGDTRNRGSRANKKRLKELNSKMDELNAMKDSAEGAYIEASDAEAELYEQSTVSDEPRFGGEVIPVEADTPPVLSDKRKKAQARGEKKAKIKKKKAEAKKAKQDKKIRGEKARERREAKLAKIPAEVKGEKARAKRALGLNELLGELKGKKKMTPAQKSAIRKSIEKPLTKKELDSIDAPHSVVEEVAKVSNKKFNTDIEPSKAPVSDVKVEPTVESEVDTTKATDTKEATTEQSKKSTQATKREKALKGVGVDSKGKARKTETKTQKQVYADESKVARKGHKAGTSEAKKSMGKIVKKADALFSAVNKLHIDKSSDKRLKQITSRTITTEAQLKKAQNDISKRINEIERGEKVKRQQTTEEKELRSKNKTFAKTAKALVGRILKGDARMSAIDEANTLWYEAISKIDRSIIKELKIKPLNISSRMTEARIEKRLNKSLELMNRAINTQNKRVVKASIKDAVKSVKSDIGKSKGGDSRLAKLSKSVVQFADSIVTEGKVAIDNVIAKQKSGKRLTAKDKSLLRKVANGAVVLDNMSAKEMKAFKKTLDQLKDGRIDYAKAVRTETAGQKKASIANAIVDFVSNKKKGGHKEIGLAEAVATDAERLLESVFGSDSVTVDKTYGAQFDADMHNHRMSEKSDAEFDNRFDFIEMSATKGIFGKVKGGDKKKYVWHDVMTKPTIKFGKDKITLAQASDIYATSKTEGGMDTLLKSGWSETDINSAINQLPSEFKSAIDEHAKYLATTVWNHVNSTHERVHGIGMGKHDYYHPITNTEQATSGPMSLDQLKEMYDSNGKLVDGFTRSREENQGFESLDDLNYFHKISSYEQNANRYTSHSEALDGISNILTAPEVKKHIAELSKGSGDNVGKAIDIWLEAMVSGRKSEGDGGYMDSVMRFKNKYITSVFSATLWIPVKQAGSAPAGMAYMDARGASVDFEKALVDKEISEFVNANSDLVKYRNSSKGLVYDIGTEAKKFEKAIGGRLKRGADLLSAVTDELAEFGTKGIPFVDQKITEGVWYGNYQTKLRELNAQGNRSGADAVAKKYADKVVRRTQPKHESRDIPAISRNRVVSLFRAFTGPTTNIMNTLFDIKHKKARNVSTSTVAGITVAYAASALINAMVDETRRMARHHSEDTAKGRRRKMKDAEWNLSGTDIIKAAHSQFTRNYPLLQGAVDEGIDAVTDEYSYGNDIAMNPIEGWYGLASGLGSAVNELSSGGSEEAVISTAKNIATSAGHLTGSPVGTSIDTIGDIKGLFRILSGTFAPDSANGRKLEWSKKQYNEYMKRKAKKGRRKR